MNGYQGAGAILLAAAVIIWTAPLVALAYAIVRDRFADRDDAARRVEQDREPDAEWLAVLAAVDTPLFAEVWAESLRRDLEEC